MATVLKEPGAALNYDMSDASWYVEDRWQEPFRQMRAQDPIHWTENGMFGNFWNVTSHKAIQHVEALPEIFSSSYEHGGITLADRIDDGTELVMPMFIAMDRPKHTGQRRTVAPAFTPTEMKRMSDDIRRRTAEILDGLPWDQPFDWVDKVSIELTTQMLAILFDFPWEDRRKLTEWSDWAGDIELVHSEELRQERLKHLYEMGAYFKKLWDAKINAEPTPDLISMMIHSDAMSEMDEFEFMVNLILLIVGGNDTTRNTMTGSIYGLNKFPDQYDKLLADPGLIPNFVPEVIRWQTPLPYMRRTATKDTELDGKQIKENDQILMWYISANHDEDIFDNGDVLDIERHNADRHLSFGYGIHFCMGSRIAELQLRVLWEEILQRFERIEVQDEHERVFSSFVHGYLSLPVTVTRR